MVKKDPAQIKLNILDLFVVSSSLTIAGIRIFLEITGYPQIGGDGLHIAHMLWGGALLTIALLFMLLSDKPHKFIIAVIGGVGFGFFIDEIGKFVTSDNNYFYQPTAFLIYLSLLLIWFISRLIIVRDESTAFASDAIWPPKKFEKILIVLFAISQILTGIIILLGFLINNMQILGLSGFILWAFIISAGLVTAMYIFGLTKIKSGGFNSITAGPIRMASILCLLTIYPIVIFMNEFSALFGSAVNIAVILALSKSSLKNIFKPVFKGQK